MIFKKLNDITLEDIQILVYNSVREGKSIDYKNGLAGGSDNDKKEFLADVVSFANTAGGHIVYGIQEEDGCASKIVGIQSLDVDGLIRYFDAVIQSGIEPRVEHAVKTLQINDDNYIIIIEIKNSWLKPHRVSFKRDYSFVARNSAGKYHMDINEIRKQFLHGYEVEEKIAKFREKRIAEINNGGTYCPMGNLAKMVLHLIPFESFVPDAGINFSAIELFDLKHLNNCWPMGAMGWSKSINLHGLILYSSNQDRVSSNSYVQIHRNGIIEAVCESVFNYEKKIIYSKSYEEDLLNAIKVYLALLCDMRIGCPVLVFISFVHVGGYRLGVDNRYDNITQYVNKLSDVLLLPNYAINSYKENIYEVSKPIFDIMWNCFGYARSLNFDDSGKWIE